MSEEEIGAHDAITLARRIRALRDALSAGSTEPAGSELDLAAALHAATDRLLARSAALTTALHADAARLDDVDRMAARVLLADLQTVAVVWRGLLADASGRLDSAQTDAHEARAIVARALAAIQDASAGEDSRRR